MSKQPYMPLFIDAFVADTAHLDTEQIGAYCLLLMGMWRHDAELPDNDRQLACLTRLSKRKWLALKQVLGTMLTFANGKVTQKRLTKEWKYACKISQKQRENANKRWGANRLKNNDAAHATAMPDACPQNQNHNHKESKNISEGAEAPKKSVPKRGLIRDALMASLDASHADAVIDHRASLHKPLSLRAAELLSARFREAPDPNAAADEMIANGWVGFKFQWMLNNRNQRAKQMSRTQRASMEILEEIETRGNVVQFGLSRRALCGPSDQRASGELRAATSIRAGISDNSDRPLSEPGGHTVDHASDD